MSSCWTCWLELHADNLQLTRFLRATHQVCERHNNFATASLSENWIDQAERGTWFLLQIINNPNRPSNFGRQEIPEFESWEETT